MRIAACLGLALWLAGAGLASAACPQGQVPAREVRLYLGRNIAGQPAVSEADFTAFLDAEVTPRFPDGLTVLDAQGRWRSGAGAIEGEASKVLVLILPSHERQADAGLAAIRDAYRRAFSQESVLMTSQTVCANF
ncbi:MULTISPECIES: DUF3574 domain-containing protein [Phenylobacterium]|uniref:DUF3574 domain-containing protein n=1 Tax=Phenylobacterium conjunctum TaxID=1298959 RepID=A0ABW3T2P0_9CAUL